MTKEEFEIWEKNIDKEIKKEKARRKKLSKEELKKLEEVEKRFIEKMTGQGIIGID